MKQYRKVRNDRFATITLQNPFWEVDTPAELLQTARRTSGASAGQSETTKRRQRQEILIATANY